MTNTATANAKDPVGADVPSNQDTEEITGTAAPSLIIVKKAAETSYNQVGDVLHYNYFVINDGNVTLNGPFTVTDDKAEDESCPDTDTLTPGSFIICTATYTITQADLDAGSVVNTAFADGFFGDNPDHDPA